jgi:Ran GTPase-activating protein (RanGAP) involved in mRNA processing and transport
MDTTVLKKNEMKRFLIQIPENQSSFFMELMQQHNLQVELEELSDEDEEEEWEEEDSEEDILENIKQGLREIKLINQGKLNARPISEVMKELYEL